MDTTPKIKFHDMKETSFDFGHHFPSGSSNLWISSCRILYTATFFLVLTKMAHANPIGYIYIWYTYVYHTYQPYGSYVVGHGKHANSKPQVFAPNGYKIGFFTLTFGCVFICSLGWVSSGWTQCLVKLPVMIFFTDFARQNRNCLKLQTWLYNVCVCVT